MVYELIFPKDGEKYIFRFVRNRRAEAIRMMGRWAADPALSFSWYDAAVLSQRVRQLQDPSRFDFAAVRDDMDWLDNHDGGKKC